MNFDTPDATAPRCYRAFGLALLLAVATGCSSVAPRTDEPAPEPPAQPEVRQIPEARPNQQPRTTGESEPVVSASTGTVSDAQMAAGMATPPTCGVEKIPVDRLRKSAREWSVANACLQLIKRYEGFKAEVHTGPAGKRLIGYGHEIGASDQAGPISENQAYELLLNDVRQKASSVADFIKVPVSRNEFSALVCLAYNVGANRLKGDSTIRELNAGNYHAAADQMTTLRKANDQINQQLVERRQAECALFLSP